MATSLLVNPETRIASLIKLAVKSRGIPVAAAFWLIRPEADYPSIALVIPLADKVGARDVYGRIMSALANETFAPKSFLQSRLAVFGERESREALSALRAHRSLVAKIDNYRNVEIEEIPEAVDIREDLLLDFIPEGLATIPCKIVFRPLGFSGAAGFRHIKNMSELTEIFEAFQMRADTQERISKTLEQNRTFESLVTDIGLDTQYRVKLV
jgi:hypothetical protein